MASKFVFAKINGKINHIRDLPIDLRGLKCEATCPLCNEPLIARMGEVRSHYFAHTNNSQCNFNNESALHLLAKEILYEYKSITLPGISLKYLLKSIHHEETEEYVKYLEAEPILIDDIKKTRYLGMDIHEFIPYRANKESERGHISDLKYYPLRETSSVEFDSIELEKGYMGKIIDLIGVKNNSKLGIEIKVTHAVDSHKRQFLRDNNLPTVEIDLSNYLEINLDDDFNIEEFKNMLIYSIDYKRWIVIKDELKEVDALERKLKEEYSRLKEDALNKAKYLKEQQKIAYKEYEEQQKIAYEEYAELFRYYTNKIELFKEKKYKEIKQRYFIPWDKEKSIQDRLINKMSESGRFDEIYIGKFIPAANLYFNCDFKTWQAIIFYKFIISKNIDEIFTINDIITFYQTSDKTKEYVDRQFYNVSIEQDDIRRFKQVILDYLNYLCVLDILTANNNYSYYDIQFRIEI